MTHKVYLVTDLGPGDGGKGGGVHKVSYMTRAHTIIKVGGAQGSHGVRTSRGEKFNFSQWGCGTFEGVRTHLTSRMVVSPEGLLNESDLLKYQWGIHNAFDLLTVDRDALCATPYHGISSRIKELSRASNPRGTIGTGIGEAYRYHAAYPDLTITAGDLASPDIKDRLAAIRQRVRDNLVAIAQGEFLSADRPIVEQELDHLGDDGFLDYVTQRFQEVARRAQIVSPAYLGENILSRDGVAVVESSHGVLTDRYLGFHPHTSALRTLPRFTHQMLEAAGYTGRVVNLGITRAYAIRHGAGPLPSGDPALAETLLPGSNKHENRYQGKVRVGPLDLVLLRYAIAACGGPAAFDGLAISWFDQIQANNVWRISRRYKNATDPAFFTPLGEIKVRHGDDDEQLARQGALAQRLFGCLPEVEAVELPPEADRDALFSLCANLIQRDTDVPVRMVSFGPTELEKLCK